jgi:hypothetical protein
MVTLLEAATAVVVTAKFALELPALTVTVAGTTAAVAGSRSASGSLDRYALRQIARLIHVTSTPYGNVVSQQLQPNNLENRGGDGA